MAPISRHSLYSAPAAASTITQLTKGIFEESPQVAPHGISNHRESLVGDFTILSYNF